MVVTHELASIFAIGDNCVFLDPNTRTMRAQGNPRELLKHSTDPAVQEFLTRGEASAHPLPKPTPDPMSKKANTTSIGLFIVIGVALGVIGLLLFSSSKMFSKTHECHRLLRRLAQRSERRRSGQVPRRHHRLGQAGDGPLQPGAQ